MTAWGMGNMEKTETAVSAETRSSFESEAFSLLESLLDFEKNENSFREANEMPLRFCFDAGMPTDGLLDFCLKALKGELPD